MVAAQKLAQCNEVSNSLKLYIQRNSFVTQRYMFVTQRYRFVTQRYMFVTQHHMFVTLHFMFVTQRYVFVTQRYMFVTQRYMFVTQRYVLTLCSHYTGQLCVPTCTTIRCSMNTYPICDSPLKRSARRSFTPLQISPPQKRRMCEPRPYPIWF